MKKLFTKSLIAVGVAGLMGLTSVAMAAEANWYGSIRAGVTSNDTDGAGGATVTSGANTFSRIGINASTDLGNGQSAGTNIEINLDAGTTLRRQNVWLNGGWGKLTFGKQNGIYRNAANWDQSWFLGGNVRFGGDVDSATGISYESNLDGPFSFAVQVVSAADTEGAGQNNSKAIGNWATTAHYDFGVATVNLGIHRHSVDDTVLVPAIAGFTDATENQEAAAMAAAASGADADAAAALVNANAALVNAATAAAVATNAIGTGEYNFDNTVLSVNGSAGGFGYYVAYEKSELNVDGGGKANTIGMFLSYDVSNSDKVYLEYERGKIDEVSNKRQATLVGYSHNIGEGVDFIAEYATVKSFLDLKTNNWNLSLKYDF